jgi:biopolymer transport protein ExbD
MKRIHQYRQRRSKPAEINMAPLIDMIFILLIFFLVTTSFVKQSGVEIERPVAKSAETGKKAQLIVEITKNHTIYIEGKHVDYRQVYPRMKRFVSDTPKGHVIIVADKKTNTGWVIRVMDECRLAGIQNISIAAKKTES